MMPRRRHLLLLLALVLLAGVGAWALTYRAPQAPDEFGHLQVGMTHEEVVKALGGVAQTGFDDSSRPGVATMSRSWFFQDGCVNIRFESGKVREKAFVPYRRESMYHRACRWLGLCGTVRAD